MTDNVKCELNHTLNLRKLPIMLCEIRDQFFDNPASTDFVIDVSNQSYCVHSSEF